MSNGLFILCILLPVVQSLENGLGLVPPMGWNSWNAFHCDINETRIFGAADQIVDLKLSEVGYTYLNIDDCWMHNERVDGKYVGDYERFAGGMKNVGDYIHSKGLRFGIYTSAGEKTCAGYPGSLGHEEIDALTFAEWGVDYLKYDNCYADGLPSIDRFPRMRDALNATGRLIYYSLCQWGKEDSWQWAPAVSNSWRTTEDIQPTWKSIRFNFWLSQQHAERSQPGAWLDPDMLEVGNGGLSFEENKSHFSLWCLAKSPLLLGMDLYTISEETYNIVTNTKLIRVNQDPHASQATCFSGCHVLADWSILATRITGGATVVVVINWCDEILTDLTIAGSAVGIVPSKDQKVQVIDLWTDEEVGVFGFESLKAVALPAMPAHGCVVYQFNTVTDSSIFIGESSATVTV